MHSARLRPRSRPEKTLGKAIEVAKVTSGKQIAQRTPVRPFKLLAKPIFGYVAIWLSELGRSELSSLLQYVNANLHHYLEERGLYYPRNDEPINEALECTHMDPFSGNAAIAYARLNVEDGMKKLWEKSWTRQQVSARPWVDEVTLADGIYLLRGAWD